MVFEEICGGLANPVAMNLMFSGLTLWAGFGKRLKFCAVMTAMFYVMLLISQGRRLTKDMHLPSANHLDKRVNGDVAEWSKALPC